MSTLFIKTRALLDACIDAYGGTSEATRLASVRKRLDEPLRVAIAGKVKAGKSTLLNALVGEELAPTDAGECTRIVTWYRDGITYRVSLHPRGVAPVQVSFRRDEGALDIDLAGLVPEQIERLVVDWPSSALRTLTLIDTPGIDSVSVDISRQTLRALAPDDDRTAEADAVIYLMRHLHASDVRFLEAFHDDAFAHAAPVHTIGVLSRADEVGVGRLDAMASAERVAARYRTDDRLRRLCQTIVPVAGLVAQAGVTLREEEFRHLQVLGAVARTDLDSVLLTADRFLSNEADELTRLTEYDRRRLLDRFGLFGIRLSVSLIRLGGVERASELAGQLVERSGLATLRRTLGAQLAERRDLLKARAALAAVDEVLRNRPVTRAPQLLSELEAITASAHELVEVRMLNAIRSGSVTFRDGDEQSEVERMLGAQGSSAFARLAIGPDASPLQIRSEAQRQLDRWQRRAESPLASRAVADAARVLVRTCEGMLTGSW